MIHSNIFRAAPIFAMKRRNALLSLDTEVARRALQLNKLTLSIDIRISLWRIMIF